MVPAAKVAQRVMRVAASGPVVSAALRSAAGLGERAQRHGLVPAAVRVERTRSQGRRGETAEQTALTLWFGQGPALPSPGMGRGRIVAGTAIAMVGAAALGAAGYLAAQRDPARVSSVLEPRHDHAADPGAPVAALTERAAIADEHR